jgi:hypothetical protein
LHALVLLQLLMLLPNNTHRKTKPISAFETVMTNEANKQHGTWEICAHYTHCFAHINTIITNTDAL